MWVIDQARGQDGQVPFLHVYVPRWGRGLQTRKTRRQYPATLIVSYAEIVPLQAALRFRQFSRYSAEWQTMIKILSLSVVS